MACRVVYAVIVALVSACSLYAADPECSALWKKLEIDGGLPKKGAAYLYGDSAMSQAEGLWITDGFSFVIMKAPDNDCNVVFRMVMVNCYGGKYKGSFYSRPGEIIGLVLKGPDDDKWDCIYKWGYAFRPRETVMRINESGKLVIEATYGKGPIITATKTYPDNKAPEPEEEWSPLNGPIRRN